MLGNTSSLMACHAYYNLGNKPLCPAYPNMNEDPAKFVIHIANITRELA